MKTFISLILALLCSIANAQTIKIRLKPGAYYNLDTTETARSSPEDQRDMFKLTKKICAGHYFVSSYKGQSVYIDTSQIVHNTFYDSFLSEVSQQRATKIQLPLSENGQIVYERIVKLDSTYKRQALFTAVRTWFVNTFNSSKAVIQSEDEPGGRIIGKAYVDINVATGMSVADVMGGSCYFTIQIDVKDGKYRCIIHDIYTEGTDIMNNVFKRDVTPLYLSYMHDDFKGKALYSKERYDRNCYNAFSSMDLKITMMIVSLNKSLTSSKKDDF